MGNALLSFFRQDKDLLSGSCPLRLRLAHTAQMLEDVMLLQQVNGNESICGGYEYRILCVSLDAFIPLKELIALPVAVEIVTDRGDLRSLCGIVTEARAGDSDGGLASYQLVLRDALSIMEKRNNTRVFRDKSEVEIVQVILDEWLQTNPVIGTCFRYEFSDSFRSEVYPPREFTMPYNEPDAAFTSCKLLLKARKFHTAIEQTYHPQSYAHYGADPERRSWQTVTWIYEVPVMASNWQDMVIATDNQQGSLTLASPLSLDRQLSGITVKLEAAEGAGDQTVPIRSSDHQLQSGKFKGIFRQLGYEHQASYHDLHAIYATLFSIAKLALTMKWSK